MDIREEMLEALDQEDFPSRALLAQAMARLDKPAPGRRHAWPAPLAAGLIAVALVVTLVIVRINGVAPTLAPTLTDDRPLMQVASTVTGLVSYQWVSSQVAWLNLAPPGPASREPGPFQADDTVIARTVDGGRTWHRELSLTGLMATPRAQFFNEREGVVIGQPLRANGTPLVIVWRTSDGGAHWNEYPLTPDPADLRPADPRDYVPGWQVAASYFLDGQRGWLMLTAGPYLCGGCMFFDTSARVFQTTDGGANWSKSATLDYHGGSWLGIRFATPTTGLVWTYSGPLYVTHDGGHSWSVVRLPVPGDPLYPEIAQPEPANFLSENEVLMAIDLANVVTVPCFDVSGHNVPSAGNVPPYCQNPNYVIDAVARYVYSSSDGGLSWARSPQIPIKGQLSRDMDSEPQVDFLDAHRWVVVDSDGVAETTNGGATWSAPRRIPAPAGWYVNQGLFLDPSRGWVTVADNPEATYITAKKPGLYPAQLPWPKFAMLGTSDGGATWHTVPLPQA